MMCTLLETISSAHQNASKWTISDVNRTLEYLSIWFTKPKVDWQQGDEEWASILGNNGQVGIVYAKFPLVILSRAGNLDVDKIDLPKLIHSYVVDDFEQPVISCSRNDLEQIFEKPLSKLLDYSHLSVSDLWWTTIS